MPQWFAADYASNQKRSKSSVGKVMSQFERSDAAGPRDCVPQKLREPERHRLLGRASTCQVSAGRSPAVRKLGHYRREGKGSEVRWVQMLNPHSPLESSSSSDLWWI